jgi:hypothetical protein
MSTRNDTRPGLTVCLHVVVSYKAGQQRDRFVRCQRVQSSIRNLKSQIQGLVFVPTRIARVLSFLVEKSRVESRESRS